MRARRVEVRRTEGRRRLRIVFWLLVVVCSVVWALVVVRSPLLDVDRVQVTGTRRTEAAAVRAAIGIGPGSPLFELDSGAAERRIATLPWVATVRVRRMWPGTVRVVVTERSPVAQIRGVAGWALVDVDGRVLGRSADPVDGVVPLSGPAPAEPGTTLGSPWGRALVVADALSDGLVARAASISVDAGDVTLTLDDGAVVLVGESGAIEAKVLALETLLALNPTEVCRIDVRVPSAPALTRGSACA